MPAQFFYYSNNDNNDNDNSNNNNNNNNSSNLCFLSLMKSWFLQIPLFQFYFSRELGAPPPHTHISTFSQWLTHLSFLDRLSPFFFNSFRSFPFLQAWLCILHNLKSFYTFKIIECFFVLLENFYVHPYILSC